MLTGQCLCGGIRFTYQGPLGPIALCHCSQCRRVHGSAFSASAPIQRVHWELTSGGELVREFESRPGKYRAFCGTCGSALYSRVDAIPGILRLRLGVINEPIEKQPASHVFVASKADWFEITDQIPQYDKLERTNDPN